MFLKSCKQFVLKSTSFEAKLFRLKRDEAGPNVRITNSKDIRTVYEFWKQKFTKLGVSEPKESIEHILAFNLGSTKVKTTNNIPSKRV